MITASNMSNAEHVKLNGTLPMDRIEPLLAMQASYDKITDMGVQDSLHEAKVMFPDNDFANDVLADLREMMKRVRGDNRHSLEDIIFNLEAVQKEVYDTAMEGVKILETIIKEMEQL